MFASCILRLEIYFCILTLKAGGIGTIIDFIIGGKTKAQGG